MNLIAHLNELNMYLQGENQLICAMFQTVTEFKMKLNLWQAQAVANNFMHFDVLAKHSPVNSEKYAAVLSILIKEFENRFQDLQKKHQFFCCCCICNSVFSTNKYIACTFSQGMCRVAIKYSIQKKFIMSLH